jgi:hypothetical protein
MIDWNFVVAISCLAISIAMGIHMAYKNLQDTDRIQRNLEARRGYKREKNRRLARFYGIDLDKKD